MASSSQRMVHQDYIARIRYSNTLPPPPNPPKLLDIPNTGLASGQYTTPGFASRLARDQPLNIEADAELGMPLDLVGMPGIFDGDESSIQAPLHPPPVHAHDRALLRPLASLGKPKFSDSGVSFLRRTEYISNASKPNRFESTTSRSLIDKTGSRNKRAPANADKESPEYIKSQAEKSFTIATNMLNNLREVRHPSGKTSVRVLEAYPILPDLDSFPDAGGYCTIKFNTNPVPPSSTYDVRLEHALLKPVEAPEEEERARQIIRENYERDPEHYPAPDDTLEYEFFMAESASDARRFKRKFDALDPEKDGDELYTQKTNHGEGCFAYKRIRPYESESTSGSIAAKFDDEIVLAVHDGTDGLRQRAVYYYPIVQKIRIRPQRNKNIQSKRNRYTPGAPKEDTDRQTDYLHIMIEDPDETMQAERDVFRTMPFGKEEVEEVEEDGEGEADADADA
ncbi:RNA polymerase II-associated [Rhexocercosporidium sp. MPI-PUGE-AT-0058]|nr:RNA polymerase II-associated [Rhexocercosporidium sp. MPI-PUGE-AT-0058]